MSQPTLNFPACYFAESRLIPSCSSCIRPCWPQRGSPPSLRTCPALSQETGPRARATSFLLPAMGQAGWGAILAPQGADWISSPSALGAHSPALLGSENRAASRLYAKPACISAKKPPLAGSCSPALGKSSRKSGNRRILHKMLPKSLPPTERVPVWAVRAVQCLSDSSVGLDGQISVAAKTPSSIYVWPWKDPLCDRRQDPIRYEFGNGHPSNGSAQPSPFWMEVANNTSA